MIGEIDEYLVPIHSNLTSSIESCQINYKGISTLSEFSSQQELIEQFYTKLEDKRKDEITRGISLIGPHRDDLEILISGKEARAYASQGQARTFGLSLRLAEAQYLSKHRADEPVLLLDDVFSELDSHRRNQVLESTKMYEVTEVITCIGHNNFTTAVMANKDFYDGLSDADKEVVQNASDAAFEYILEYQSGLQEKSLDNIAKAKPDMQINILSEEERQPFKDKAASVEEAFIEMTGDSGKEILDQFKADLEAVK